MMVSMMHDAGGGAWRKAVRASARMPTLGAKDAPKMGHPAAIPPLRSGMTNKGLGEDDAGAVGGFVFDGLQGFVGLVEREDPDLRLDADFGG